MSTILKTLKKLEEEKSVLEKKLDLKKLVLQDEDNFGIDDAGTYTLIISTSETEDVGVVGGIGHVPDSTGVTISIAGFIVIMTGMIGVIVIGFMIIRQRKKKIS